MKTSDDDTVRELYLVISRYEQIWYMNENEKSPENSRGFCCDGFSLLYAFAGSAESASAASLFTFSHHMETVITSPLNSKVRSVTR
jgi:hypothetical protein